MDTGDIRITIGTTAALWGATIVGAEASGLFGKFDFEETAALAGFVTAFAVATYFLDPSVKTWIESIRHRIAIAIVIDAALAFAWPYVPALLFGLPIAAVMTMAAVRRETPAIKSAAGKSPGVHPAAT
jgi:hypothetical protein